MAAPLELTVITYVDEARKDAIGFGFLSDEDLKTWKRQRKKQGKFTFGYTVVLRPDRDRHDTDCDVLASDRLAEFGGRVRVPAGDDTFDWLEAYTETFLRERIGK